nr:snurportin-1 [Ipomoea batatas]
MICGGGFKPYKMTTDNGQQCSRSLYRKLIFLRYYDCSDWKLSLATIGIRCPSLHFTWMMGFWTIGSIRSATTAFSIKGKDCKQAGPNKGGNSLQNKARKTITTISINIKLGSVCMFCSIFGNVPIALPNSSRRWTNNKSAQSYCILDCVFHESDQTYYVTDMVCWAGFSLYECTAEFRFYWLNTKLAETGACDAPSTYHRYRFSSVPVYDCVQEGLHSAYTGPVPYVKDGLLFYNKQAHYQTGNTPLALVWKDTNCSQYVIDTDNKGEIPTQQQVVLELLDDGRLATSDDPPVIFGCLNGEFIQKTGLHSGDLLRFSVSEGGLVLVDGKLEKADLQYLGKPNRSRAFADSYSKVLFQYAVRHSPLQIEHIFASISSPVSDESASCDTEMAG